MDAIIHEQTYETHGFVAHGFEQDSAPIGAEDVMNARSGAQSHRKSLPRPGRLQQSSKNAGAKNQQNSLEIRLWRVSRASGAEVGYRSATRRPPEP